MKGRHNMLHNHKKLELKETLKLTTSILSIFVSEETQRAHMNL